MKSQADVFAAMAEMYGKLKFEPLSSEAEQGGYLGDMATVVVKGPQGKMFRYPNGCYMPAGYSYVYGPPTHPKDMALPRLR